MVRLYIDHNPTKYITIKEALNQNLLRLENLGHFHRYLANKQLDDYFSPKSELRLWLLDENPVGEEYYQKSRLVEVLHRLVEDKSSGIHKGKILIVSVFRSVYEITLELLSAVSDVPLTLLKGGLPGEGYKTQWGFVAKGVNLLAELPLFFFEYAKELPTFEQLLEQMYRSRVDDGFNRLIFLSGLANLREFNQTNEPKLKQLFVCLENFADKYCLDILVIP